MFVRWFMKYFFFHKKKGRLQEDKKQTEKKIQLVWI